ncbi:F-box/kelch-repeat protein At3g06240-like [Neltuma alba]|uniref:F-box/kelch-repeat protein At3g06240-like n=1 Tax=Neltuma alba TaxID=207710 RepID=UPI0010A2B76C|nr:F-box/kelch-repeat protein At3g06240-like [Prosopis alba]
MVSDDYYLHEDLMEEIMVRLPVKSLLRFKCVAKSWYALITDPSFISKHLERSNSISKNLHLKLIFQLFSQYLPVTISLISNIEQPRVIRNLELPCSTNDLKWILVYGQCNGIFFLCGDYEGDVRCSILWNPATKEVKAIPTSQRQPKGINPTNFGFGFDPITKDYKVVRFPICPVEKNDQPLVEVYNLSTNSWRKIDADVSFFEFPYSYRGPYLNGAYHWLCRDLDEINKFIVSFDFSKEVFKIIQSPPGITSSSTENNLLTTMDECLAWFVKYDSIEFRVEIWVMNEYGVESSWSKKFVVRPFSESWHILGFWGDNEILVYENISGQMISYNFRNGQRQRLQNHFPTMKMMDYVESLCPLGGKGKYQKI